MATAIIGGGRPRALLLAIFQAQMGPLVEPPTFRMKVYTPRWILTTAARIKVLLIAVLPAHTHRFPGRTTDPRKLVLVLSTRVFTLEEYTYIETHFFYNSFTTADYHADGASVRKRTLNISVSFGHS